MSVARGGCERFWSTCVFAFACVDTSFFCLKFFFNADQCQGCFWHCFKPYEVAQLRQDIQRWGVWWHCSWWDWQYRAHQAWQLAGRANKSLSMFGCCGVTAVSHGARLIKYKPIASSAANNYSSDHFQFHFQITMASRPEEIMLFCFCKVFPNADAYVFPNQYLTY